MMIILITLQITFGSFFLRRSNQLKDEVFDSFKNLTTHDGRTPNKSLIPLDHPIHAIQRHVIIYRFLLIYDF